MNALQIPWETVNIKGVWIIRQVDGWTIAETPGAYAVEKENALLIVRAVNSHADLVQNLARLVERVQKVNAALRSKGETEFVGAWFGDGILTEVQSALQKAEVQS